MASTAQPSHAGSGSQLDNRRIAAAAIDCAAPGLALLALMAGGLLTPAVFLVVVGWTLYYFFALESGGGQTFGKRLMRLRVVTLDGGEPTMEQFAQRNLVRALDLPLVGLVVMLTSGERRQRLGDRVAHTMVVDAGDAAEIATATAPAPKPVAAEKPKRRGLGGPELKLPSLRLSALTLPAVKLPAMGRSRSSKPASPQHDREVVLPDFFSDQSAVEPTAPAVAPEPEPRQFDPFDEETPAPAVEVMHSEAEAPVEFETDEPAVDFAGDVVADHGHVPEVEVVHEESFDDYEPEPLDSPQVWSPAPPAAPAPLPPQPTEPPAMAELDAEHSYDPYERDDLEHSDAVRDDGSPRLNVKPIETVSPLELLMQDAMDGDEPDSDSSL